MNDPALAELIARLDEYLKLDRLPDLAVLLLGIGVGIVAKNLYALLKGLLGFAGSFFGRLFVGWWQDIRRETPNVIDIAMVVPLNVEGRTVLMMDALIGPTRLTDLYINSRTAFGVRIQAFFTKKERPWIYFPMPRETVLGRTVRRWRNARRLRRGLKEHTLEWVRRIKYRRVYQPVENVVGQFLTNEWAVSASMGEPVYLFRFVVAIVYEKFADDYVDRQFHGLVIWDALLANISEAREMISLQPEFRHRVKTLRRLSRHYRSSITAQQEFGSILIAIPRSLLSGRYIGIEVETATGDMITIHRPAQDGLDPRDAALIRRGVSSAG